MFTDTNLGFHISLFNLYSLCIAKNNFNLTLEGSEEGEQGHVAEMLVLHPFLAVFFITCGGKHGKGIGEAGDVDVIF